MDEPNLVIRWAMYHFASGDSYLIGLALFAVCQMALLRTRQATARRWLIVGSRAAIVWAVAVLPPVPLALLVIFPMVAVAWIISQWRRRKAAGIADTRSKPEQIFRATLTAVAVAAIAWEVQYHVYRCPDVQVTSLCVVGDSVTAGLNNGDDTWPRQLARAGDVQVLDASQPGATLKSALKQVELLKSLPGEVLLLEIGGNDLLEGLAPEDFERDLDRLLAASQTPKRSVVMFELPLPPLAMRYGQSQRRLAQQYQVSLVPRRCFLSVLTANGSTVDGIHLATAGHSRLQELVQNLLKLPVLASSHGTYRHLDPPRGKSATPN